MILIRSCPEGRCTTFHTIATLLLLLLLVVFESSSTWSVTVRGLHTWFTLYEISAERTSCLCFYSEGKKGNIGLRSRVLIPDIRRSTT